MITVEIIDSIDKNRVGTYEFHKNMITIGSHYDDNIYIPELNLSREVFKIECKKDAIYIYPHTEVDRYHINKKINTTFKKLKQNDLISYNNLILKLVYFEYEELKSIEVQYNEYADIVLTSDPKKNEIIQKLGKHEELI